MAHSVDMNISTGFFNVLRSLWNHRNDLFVGSLLLAVFASSLWVFESTKALEKQWEIRRAKEAEVNKLIDLSIQYPDYRDLLYRLAVSQSELGNDAAAREALSRAGYLDSNNETLIKIADILDISLSN